MALQNVFVRDECRVSDKYLDAFRQNANRHIGGGTKYVLTSHVHKQPSLSKVYDVAENVCKVGVNGILQFSHNPMNLSET
eukprot:2703797-Ditylum_brightwellii.AAC.1